MVSCYYLGDQESKILEDNTRLNNWSIQGDDADPDMALIDHDGGLLRRRYIERQDSIIFNETIFTSEAHPGKDKYTVLMYGTDDSGWRNKQVFRNRHGSKIQAA